MEQKKNCVFYLVVFQVEPISRSVGEGVAFILTKDFKVPANSHGQWLGIVNASTAKSSDSNVVAIEFDTKKSFAKDIDSNHVGLDINSVDSYESVSLNKSGITIASDGSIRANIDYDGRDKVMTVSITRSDEGSEKGQLFSVPVDLSQYLPREIYVGFSGSTGSGFGIQEVTTWYFIGDDIGQDMELWIPVAVVFAAVLLCVGGGFMYLRYKRNRRDVLDDHPSIPAIEAVLCPKRIKLKDLLIVTDNFNPRTEIGRGGFGIVYRGP